LAPFETSQTNLATVDSMISCFAGGGISDFLGLGFGLGFRTYFYWTDAEENASNGHLHGKKNRGQSCSSDGTVRHPVCEQDNAFSECHEYVSSTDTKKEKINLLWCYSEGDTNKLIVTD